MKSRSTIAALLIGLALLTLACGKSAANMSDEDKYKLFYAATQTKDRELMSEVAKKIGIINADGSPTASYKSFIDGAMAWGQKNTEFAQEILSPEKAREYVKSHMPS